MMRYKPELTALMAFLLGLLTAWMSGINIFERGESGSAYFLSMIAAGLAWIIGRCVTAD